MLEDALAVIVGKAWAIPDRLITSKDIIMRKFTSAFLLACVALLSACGNSRSVPRDPTPDADQRLYYANSKLAPMTYGKPLSLDGCQVQLYRVIATHPGVIGKDFLTVATATCPTAVVKSTQQSCGKNCVQESVSVQKPVLEPSGIQALKHRKAELKEEMRKLQASQARAAAQLEELEQTLPN